MKTVFLNGLMPERHGHFMGRVAAEYTVAGTQLPDLSGVPGRSVLDFMEAGDMAAEIVAAGIAGRLEEQTAQLADRLARDIRHSPHSPPEGWTPAPQYVQEVLRGKVAGALVARLRFREFHRKHPVDLVISGSDYAAHARPIVLEARQLEIPTLNLEHGFFFTRTAPGFVRRRGWMPTFFASEFVNLDNALEAALLQGELDMFGYRGPRFLTLGTPIETVASPHITRQEAVRQLGLDGNRMQVLIMGSWHEARNLQKLLTSQLDTLRSYRSLLTELARRPNRDRMQLVIKLHPAEARPSVFPAVKAGLESLAARCGLEAPLILGDKLPQVLAACDVMVTMGFSSVQYDAYLLGKPSIAIFPPSIRKRVPEGWFRAGTLPMEHGVCEVATDGPQAWGLAEAFLDEERRARFAEDARVFAERYGLEHRPLDAKCDALLEWMAGIGSPGTGYATAWRK